MFYTDEVGPSWFLSLCKVARVLKGLLAALAFIVYVVPAHLLGMCYDYVFALIYLNWIGMLCWETS